MYKYTKIETLHKREETGSHKLIETLFREPEYFFLKDNVWVGTEKIDGANIGVVWDGYKVSFQGRTEKSEIPKYVLDMLNKKFSTEIVEEVFEQKFGSKQVILFGEAYGHKIQKVGDKYKEDIVDFILFDVYMPESNLWLERPAIEDIATTFNLEVVPVIFRGTLDEAVEFVKSKPLSKVAESPLVIEGIVCKPEIDLLNRRGERMIVKVKVCDYEA